MPSPVSQRTGFLREAQHARAKYGLLYLMLAAIWYAQAGARSSDPESNYTLFLVPAGESKCLDGSRPAFYYRRGKDQLKWLIYFESGEICGDMSVDSTLVNCYAMSQTDFGSSSDYPNFLNMDDQGILSSLFRVNKYFYLFNVVYVKSCDGSLFQGYNEDPYMYNNSLLWFRGYANVNETISYLSETLGMNEANEIAVGGCSTGGVATFLWIDEIQRQMQQANARIRVYGLPDNGILMNEVDIQTMDYKFKQRVINLMQYSNVEMDPPIAECRKTYPKELWKCLFVEYVIYMVRAQMFITQSQYDLWTISNVMGISCANDCSLSSCTNATKLLINKYRSDLLKLKDQVAKEHHSWGFWMPACVYGCFCNGQAYSNDTFAVPMSSGNNTESSLLRWRIGQQVVLVDEGQWPSNAPCSNQ